MTNAVVQGVSGQCGALVTIKIVHTAIWAFFAACILALPVTAWLRRFRWAAVLTGLVLIECCVLALNGGRCPLTGLAGKYASDRSPAFDIYLPVWLAAHNKAVFGCLFLVNEVVVLWQWMRMRRGKPLE